MPEYDGADGAADPRYDFCRHRRYRRLYAELDEQIRADEDRLDLYEDKLGTYLVKLSSKELSERDSNEISKLLHSIGDFERIGDHAVNLLAASKELWESSSAFLKGAARAGRHAQSDP